MVNNKENRIFVTFSEPLYSRIREAAEDSDISLSTTVKIMVKEWFTMLDAKQAADGQAKSGGVLHGIS